VTLELTQREARDLEHALKTYLRSLMEEIVHTQDLDLRHTIHSHWDRLESIRSNLGNASESTSARG
jgi:hypothetical protein